MKLKYLLFSAALLLLGASASQLAAQTFAGPVDITNGQLNLNNLFSTITFGPSTNQATISSGGFRTPSGIFFNAPGAFIFTNPTSTISPSPFNNKFIVNVDGASIIGSGNLFSPSSGNAQFLVLPNGDRNPMGHLETGTFGDITSTAKWIALGSAPPAAGASVYGKRIQWDQNFAVFNLREQSATDRNLVVQWGGTTANNQLLFEYANGPFATASTYLQIESNGNVGIGATPFSTDKLRVNGRIRFGSAEWIEDGGANTTRISSTIIPDIDNRWDLGSTSFRWDDIFATNGVIQTSDRREKKEIKKLDYGLTELMKLEPVSYKWKRSENQGTQIGLIAQDVEKVMSEIVYNPAKDLAKDENGNVLQRKNSQDLLYGLNYMEFIPVIINAVQEQQRIIEKQSEEINSLKQQLTDALTAAATTTPGSNPTDQDPTLEGVATLVQNIPNPFSESTEINFFLPEKISNAKLYIYNMNGGLIKQFSIAQRGQSSLTIEANSLQPGIYLYTIVADNQDLGVKRMIIQE